MNKETLYELRSLVALYPYYQPARLLMLKNMYLLHDSSFDEELQRASIYISDRNALFNLVEIPHYKQQETDTQQHTQQDETKRSTLSIIDNYLDSTELEQPSYEFGNNDAPTKPTPADATVDYVAYLMKTEHMEDRSATEQQPQMKGQNLIDDFINDSQGRITLQETPTYTPPSEENDEEQSTTDEGYFTETLAQIYIKQGRYSKALEIIQRLNLNYPKKNAYFADQIRFLKKLIINNKNNKQ